MEFSIKCLIGYVPYYNYRDYVYFNNTNNTPNEHDNNFALNHRPDLYIKLPLKLMDDIF